MTRTQKAALIVLALLVAWAVWAAYRVFEGIDTLTW